MVCVRTHSMFICDASLDWLISFEPWPSQVSSVLISASFVCVVSLRGVVFWSRCIWD